MFSGGDSTIAAIMSEREADSNYPLAEISAEFHDTVKAAARRLSATTAIVQRGKGAGSNGPGHTATPAHVSASIAGHLGA